jgi:hypothetical protein
MKKSWTKWILFSLTALALTSCADNSASQSGVQAGSGEVNVEGNQNQDFGTDEYDFGYYRGAAFLLDLNDGANTSSTICTTFYEGPKSCLFYGDIVNNGDTPIEFYAEVWAEDVLGRKFISEGKYSIFEGVINPGMSSGITLQFRLNPGVRLKRVFLVDVGGPDAVEILSASADLLVP